MRYEWPATFAKTPNFSHHKLPAFVCNKLFLLIHTMIVFYCSCQYLLNDALCCPEGEENIYYHKFPNFNNLEKVTVSKKQDVLIFNHKNLLGNFF